MNCFIKKAGDLDSNDWFLEGCKMIFPLPVKYRPSNTNFPQKLRISKTAIVARNYQVKSKKKPQR